MNKSFPITKHTGWINLHIQPHYSATFFANTLAKTRHDMSTCVDKAKTTGGGCCQESITEKETI